MRSATKTFVGLAGLGVLIAAARAGLPVASAADVLPTETPTATATPTPAETPTATETPAATATPTPKATTTTKPTTTTTTKKPAATSGSKTSAAIGYEFGVVQVKVTKSSGKITAVDLIQGTATKGRDQAFPTLIQATIDSNGTGFGNLSGATYTTKAFKKAVKNALAKF